MRREIFESDIGESYLKATLSSGLKIYILEKPQYNSSYAIFGTKYGSIDTVFSANGEETAVPEGIAHFLEHKLFESEDGDAFSKYAKTLAGSNPASFFSSIILLLLISFQISGGVSELTAAKHKRFYLALQRGPFR